MSITTDAAYVYRDKITPGSPTNNNPSKAAIRDLFAQVDQIKAPTDLGGDTTFPVLDSGSEQPSSAQYLRPRLVLLSDMRGLYSDDPTDDNSDAFTALLAAATDGLASGHIGLPAGRTRLSSPGGTLVKGTNLAGVGSADMSLVGSSPWAVAKSSLVFDDPVVYSSPGVVNVAATITARNTFKGLDLTYADGVTVSGLNLFRESVITDPASPAEYMKRIFRATNVSEAVSGWATIPGWAGDGLTLDSAMGAKVHDVTIAGFNRALVVSGCERFRIERVLMDCNNGVDVAAIFDVSNFNQISFWGAFAAGWLRSYLGAPGSPGYAARKLEYDEALMRSGIGFYMHEAGGSGRAGDGVQVSQFLSIGAAVAQVKIEDANVCQFSQMWLDNHYSQMNVTHPYIGLMRPVGLTTAGTCQNNQFSQIHVDSNYDNYSWQHDGGGVGPVISTITSGNAYNEQMVFGPNKGSVDGFQYGGNAGSAALRFASGVEEWSLDHIKGVGVGTTPVTFKMDPTTGRTDMRKLRFGEFTHNGQSVDTREMATYIDIRPAVDQSISAAANNYTKVTLPLEYFDSLAEATGSTVTVASRGDYEIEWNVSLNCTGVTAGHQGSMLYLNGVRFGETNTQYFTPNVASRKNFSGHQRVTLGAGQTIELYALLEPGGSVEADFTYLRVYRVPDRRF